MRAGVDVLDDEFEVLVLADYCRTKVTCSGWNAQIGIRMIFVGNWLP